VRGSSRPAPKGKTRQQPDGQKEGSELKNVRASWMMGGAAGALATALVVGASAEQQTLGANAERAAAEGERIQKGLAIAPVPLNLQGRDRELVGLGSYLVNATGGCNDCHTNPPFAPGGDPFQGEPKVMETED